MMSGSAEANDLSVGQVSNLPDAGTTPPAPPERQVGNLPHQAVTRLRFLRADLLDVLTAYGHGGPQRRRLHRIADELQAVIDALDGRR
jgi:hypothetical protein